VATLQVSMHGGPWGVGQVLRSPSGVTCRDYFPMSLVKTEDLKPDKNYLFCYHPHGVISLGAVGNFCTEATAFSDKFPGECGLETKATCCGWLVGWLVGWCL